MRDASAGHSSSSATSSSAAKASRSLRYSATTPTTRPALTKGRASAERRPGASHPSHIPAQQPDCRSRSVFQLQPPNPPNLRLGGQRATPTPRRSSPLANFTDTKSSSQAHSAISVVGNHAPDAKRCHRQRLFPVQGAEARRGHVGCFDSSSCGGWRGLAPQDAVDEVWPWALRLQSPPRGRCRW